MLGVKEYVQVGRNSPKALDWLKNWHKTGNSIFESKSPDNVSVR